MFESSVLEPRERPTSLSCLVGYPTAAEQLAACRSCAPGPLVIQSLAMIDPATLDADEQLDLVAAWEQCSAWVAAQQTRALAALDLHDPSDAVLSDRVVADQALEADLAPALALSGAAAARRLAAARLLSGRLSATGAALADGRLGYLHALAMAEELAEVDPAVAVEVEQRVLRRAAGRSVASLRRLVRHEIVRVEPAEADRRAQRARARRRVQLWPSEEGMGVLQVVHGAGELRFVHDTLDAIARARGAGRAGQPGLDAGRADALVELCRLAVHGGLAAVGSSSPVDPPGDDAGSGVLRGPLPVCVNVTMSLETLLGVRDDPAYLERHGVFPPGVARELARDARWRRFVTDPVDGHLLDCGRMYEAPARLRRYLVERDRTCRFPGCVRTARRCDCDHAEPFANGGETTAANCGMLCRRHHRLKTLGLVQLVREPDGSVIWTTRLKRTYRVRAPAPDEPL